MYFNAEYLFLSSSKRKMVGFSFGCDCEIICYATFPFNRKFINGAKIKWKIITQIVLNNAREKCAFSSFSGFIFNFKFSNAKRYVSFP